MNEKMNPVVHFEMPYENKDRAAEFYSTVFGWQMQKLGQEMGEYILAITTETGEKGPQKAGAINGGFYKTDVAMPNQPSVVISVSDIRGAMQNVKNAGGKVLGEPMDIAGVVLYVFIVDSEGNRVSMLQPKEA